MAGIDDLKTAVVDVEASNAALEARVSAFEKLQSDAMAALQAEIDALKAGAGLSDADAAALAARLEAVKSSMDTVNAPAPTPAP